MSKGTVVVEWEYEGGRTRDNKEWASIINGPVTSYRWHGYQPARPTATTDLYADLSIDQTGKLGWTLQVGTANPQREVALYEVISLCPSDREWPFEDMVEKHIELVRDLTQRVHALLITGNAFSRSDADRLVDRVRDLVRLRRELWWTQCSFSNTEIGQKAREVLLSGSSR